MYRSRKALSSYEISYLVVVSRLQLITTMAPLTKKKKKTWALIGVLGVTLASAYVKPEIFSDLRDIINIVFSSSPAAEPVE